jgi:hypothetical protein
MIRNTLCIWMQTPFQYGIWCFRVWMSKMFESLRLGWLHIFPDSGFITLLNECVWTKLWSRIFHGTFFRRGVGSHHRPCFHWKALRSVSSWPKFVHHWTPPKTYGNKKRPWILTNHKTFNMSVSKNFLPWAKTEKSYKCQSGRHNRFPRLTAVRSATTGCACWRNVRGCACYARSVNRRRVGLAALWFRPSRSSPAYRVGHWVAPLENSSDCDDCNFF